MLLRKSIARLKDEIMYSIFRNHKSIQTDLDYFLISSNNHRNTFFGYYDISPFNPHNEDLLVFCANNSDPKNNPKCEFSDIIIYDIGTKRQEVLGNTRAWNWQQGCRLGWINKNEIIYNDYNEGIKDYCSYVLDINTGRKEIYDKPVQCFHGKKYFLSINYDVLELTRPDYGYKCKSSVKEFHLRHYIEFNDFRNVQKILLNNEETLGLLPDEHQALADSVRLNHLLISPSGEQFIFLLRYMIAGRTYHQLFLYNLASRRTKLLLRDVVSHYCWIDEKRILFWGSISGQSGYYFLDVEDLTISQLTIQLGDGHPIMMNEKFIITDTYPNKSGLRYLIKMEMDPGLITSLASIYQPPVFRHQSRCDPHPSISPSGRYIQVDTAHRGKRTICLFKYSK